MRNSGNAPGASAGPETGDPAVWVRRRTRRLQTRRFDRQSREHRRRIALAARIAHRHPL